MNKNSLHFILYEIAMSIGNTFNVNKMLNESTMMILSRLNCESISMHKYDNKVAKLYYMNPKAWMKNKEYLKISKEIEESFIKSSQDYLVQKLDNKYYYIFELKSFGYYILTKKTSPLEDEIIASLISINIKLLNAIEACLLDSMRKELELQLREESSLFKTIINTVPYRIYWKNEKSEYQGANKLFLEDANLINEADIVGMSDFDMPWKSMAAKYNADDRYTMGVGIDKLEYEESHIDVDGSLTWLSISSVPLKNKENETCGVLGIYHDITKMKENELNLKLNSDALQHQAYHDILTELPNRLLFNDRLNQAITKANENDKKIAVLFMDMDRFKDINDSLGHTFGDMAIQNVASRLKKVISVGDTVSRFGGDEFVMLLENIESNMVVVSLIQKIQESMKEPIVIKNEYMNTTLSIGISIYPNDGMTSEDLLRNADIAMYRAKDSGRNTYQFYNKEMTSRALSRIKLESDLREALKNEDFILYYQPQIHLMNKKTIGLETLVRWKYNESHFISPSEFIPIAEKIGLIIPLGKWILKKCMEQIVTWKKKELDIGIVAINFSMLQLEENNFVSIFKSFLEETSCQAEWIEVEVTESQVMENPEQIILTLNAIHRLGVSIAIDDFGTGYSSLSYLKKLPIDKLKIDRSFIEDIATNEEDQSIVKAIIALAKSLNLDVIAEGVETKEQEKFLVANKCYSGQGYLYSKPVSAMHIEKMLKR